MVKQPEGESVLSHSGVSSRQQPRRGVSAARCVALVGLLVAGIACHRAPTDWGAFDEKTIERNLASIDSARVVYRAQTDAGHRDSAAIKAAALLLAQSGVDSVVIAPDSTVWVLFTNGLRVGLGELPVDSGVRMPTRFVRPAPKVRIAGGLPGGEVYPMATLIVPFPEDLPASWFAATAIRPKLESVPGMLSTQMLCDSETTVERIRALLAESPVFYWAGHGLLVSGNTPGLVTGKAFDRAGMSHAAGDEYRAYLHPTPPQARTGHGLHFIIRTWVTVSVAGRRVFCRRATSSSAVLRL